MEQLFNVNWLVYPSVISLVSGQFTGDIHLEEFAAIVSSFTFCPRSIAAVDQRFFAYKQLYKFSYKYSSVEKKDAI